jgi:exonuclease III
MHLLILNGLNAPIKRHRVTNWVKKQDPTICSLQETHLTEKNKNKNQRSPHTHTVLKFSNQIDPIKGRSSHTHI